jgi:DNA-binding MarR family transcriptional regulator
VAGERRHFPVTLSRAGRGRNQVKDGSIATRHDNAGAKDGPGAKDGAETVSDALKGWTYPGLDFPTFRLVLVAKAIDRLTLRMLADNCDLTIAEWRVLSRLAPIAGATVGQVAEMAWVDRAEVSRAASALEKRGLTSRRENPQDGRSPILFCTEAGIAEYRRLLPIRANFHRSLAEDLNDQDRAALDALLLRIAKKVGGLAGE